MNIEEEPTNKISADLKNLIAEAHLYLETNDFENAIKVFKKGASMYSKYEKFCFEFGYALYEQGDFEQSIKYLKKAIKLDPKNRAQSYFTIAQMSDNQVAINLYKTGLDIAHNKLNDIQTSNLNQDSKYLKIRNISRTISQAYCALAQIEEKKIELGHFDKFCETEFLSHLTNAVKSDQNYLEGYLLGSMYYFNCQNEPLFRQTVNAMVTRIEEMEKSNDDGLDDYTCEFFLPLVRILIECQMWSAGEVLMAVGLNNDENSFEGHYLYAFCLFYQQKYQEAEEILEKLEKMKISECGDHELFEGFVELKNEILLKIKNNTGNEDPKEAEEDWLSEAETE